MQRSPQLPVHVLLVNRAVELELSERKIPSPVLPSEQLSTNTSVWNVVPPFWRTSLPTFVTTQFDMRTCDGALICANLSSPPLAVNWVTVTTSDRAPSLTVNASSPMLVQRKLRS